MIGSVRMLVSAMAVGSSALLVSLSASGQEAPAPNPGPEVTRGATQALGEDIPEPFVPLHPRTAQDREELELLRAFVSARALEDQGRRRDAIEMLETVLKKSPDSVPVLRRLSRLSLALGRTQKGLEYARKVIELEPGDTETLDRLMSFYERRDDAAGAEALLRKVLENPKLDKQSAGYLLIERDLGMLYAEKLNQPEKAADAFANVLTGLDEKAANNLSPADQKRILGEEADTYGKFGEVFAEAHRYGLAVTAFRRGLVYAPEDQQLPRVLAQALLRDGKAQQALNELESFLRTQPSGREPYEVLVDILKALGKSKEVLPRLEAAAKADEKNAALLYFLADQYREAGQPEKAGALYKTILAAQPDHEGMGELASTLLKSKDYQELVNLLGRAFAKPESLESVKPMIESIVNQPDEADALLDAGKALQEADPPALSRESRLILKYIANKAEKNDRFVAIQRVALEQNPSPQGYLELCDDLMKLGKHAEASAALEEMIDKYPEQKIPLVYRALAQTRMLSGQFDTAREAADEALKLDKTDLLTKLMIGAILSRSGKNEEAIEYYKALLNEAPPNNDEAIKRIRAGLSIAYVNLDRFDEGEKELEILYSRDPDDPGVNNDLGYLYADQGKKLEQAEAMIRKAISEEPENTSYIDSLGWVLFKRGKLEEAAEELLKAAKDPNADATIHDHLGDVYFKLKDLPKAKASWQAAEAAAAKINPPDKRLAEIRKKLESVDKLEASQPLSGGANP
jgi:tetratricopeptide (TPR) repeat protein